MPSELVIRAHYHDAPRVFLRFMQKGFACDFMEFAIVSADGSVDPVSYHGERRGDIPYESGRAISNNERLFGVLNDRPAIRRCLQDLYLANGKKRSFIDAISTLNHKRSSLMVEFSFWK